MGSSPGAVYRMDMTFFHIDLLQKLYCLFEKTKKINVKEDGGWSINKGKYCHEISSSGRFEIVQYGFLIGQPRLLF